MIALLRARAVLALALVAAAAAAAAADARCTSDEDCSLLGVCTRPSILAEYRCVCDPGWTGPDCGQLRLGRVPVGSGYNLTGAHPPTYSWGANIFPAEAQQGGSGTDAGADTWHMYAAEFENNCEISRWSPNSAIVHAVSTTGPEGPYTRKEVAVKPFAHNPKVVQAPDGTWLMFTIGVPLPASRLFNCSGRGHLQPDRSPHPSSPAPAAAAAQDGSGTGSSAPPRPGRNPSNLESNITLFTSGSLEGPWASQGVVLGADSFGTWDEDTSNPSPWVLPNGTVLLMYRGCVVDSGCAPGSICGCTREYIGVASAPHWSGPYARLQHAPILPHVAAEDPSFWVDRRGNFHFLMHYIPGRALVARHAFASSYEGPWQMHADSIPYNTTVAFTDGSVVTYNKRERPHIVFAAATGHPTHLVTGVVQPGNQRGYAGGSSTLIQPILASDGGEAAAGPESPN